LLVAAGANVNFQDDEKSTPLHCAAVNGHLDVAKLLLDNGAEVNATNASQVCCLLFKRHFTSRRKMGLPSSASCY
jgi:ankyrin repeat protein